MLGIYYTQLIASLCFKGRYVAWGCRSDVTIPRENFILIFLYLNHVYQSWPGPHLDWLSIHYLGSGGRGSIHFANQDLLGVDRGPKIYIMGDAFKCVAFHF